MNDRRVLFYWVVALIVAHLLDPFFWTYFRIEDIYSEDWGRVLRVQGYTPIWLAAALALYLHDRPVRWRASMLALSVILSGIAGELLKLVFRRERPYANFGEYSFRSFADRPLHSGGLALPSTHAVVAFGAAALLARLFPRSRYVFWGLAWGCALSRVAAGAHYLSDVVMAGLIAWGVASLLWRKAPPRSAVP
ncbi:MAG: phosphatase PAP2 family protein [Gemmatimonadota bacterium]